MQFSTLLITSVLAAFAAAQNATTAPVSSSVALTPAQSSQASCLSACNPQDPSCRASCIVVPDGDSAQNRTIECIGACPKGNGTSDDNAAFELCQKGCIASATLTSATAAATATGGSGGSTGGSGSGATGTNGGASSGAVKTATGTGASGGAATSTGAAASASSSKAAGENLRVGMSVGGVVGLFAAIIAL